MRESLAERLRRTAARIAARTAIAALITISLGAPPAFADEHEPPMPPVWEEQPADAIYENSPADQPQAPADAASPTAATPTSPSPDAPSPAAHPRTLVGGSYPANACAQPVDPAQATLDAEAVAKAAAGGLQLAVAKQCAGFSVIAQQGVDQKAVAEIVGGAELAYRRISADAGGVTARRVGYFLFLDRDARRRGAELVQGRTSTSNASRLAPAFASAGDVWVNAGPAGTPTGSRYFATSSDNYLTAAHELVHVFADAAGGDKPAPNWFEEGLAEVYAAQLVAPRDPAGTEWAHAERRALVLNALKGGPRPLLGLGEIDSHDEWDTNYPTWKGSAQYDIAYMTMLSVTARRDLPTAWKALRDARGEGPDFAAAFTRHFGLPLEAVEGSVREGWRAELGATPKTYTFSVTVAPGGSRTPTLFIATNYDGRLRGLQSVDAVAGTFTFEIDPTGNVRQTGGPSLGRVFAEDGSTAANPREGTLTVSLRNPSYRGATGASGPSDSTVHLTYYNLHFGQWSAGQPARKFSNNDKKTNEPLLGAMSAAFPDGHAVTKPS